MERAVVNGVELEYELQGTGDPVLFIHGSHIADSYMALLAQPALRDEFMLIRYHRRGYLGSAAPMGQVSLADQAADASALLAHLHVAAAHVVGHSFGGSIALQLALDDPDHVHSLVLLEAALLTVPGGAAVIDLVSVAGQHYREGDWDLAEDLFLGSPEERESVARNVPGGLEQALRDMDTYFEVEAPAHERWHFTGAEGRRVTQPVLWVQGANSSALYEQCRDLVTEWMPQTKRVVLAGATHLLHMQQPAGAAQLLADFFARHRIGPGRVVVPRRRTFVADRYNATDDLLDGQLERGRADKAAIESRSGAMTYGEVAAGANRFGNALRALGVEIEQRVLLAVLDSAEFAMAFFGAIKMGAVPVPVNTNLSPDDGATLLHDSRAKVAVVSASVADAFRSVRREVGTLRHLIVIGEPGLGELAFGEITRAAGDELSPAATTRDDVCFWLYSAGTTGRPKGVVHLQGAMRSCADAYGRHVLGITESDVTFSVSKLYFAYGLGAGLYLPFSAGATTVLLAEPPQPRLVLSITGQFHPTLFFGVPSSYVSLLAAGPSWRAADFSATRLCIAASEALPGPVLEQWRAQTGVDIIDGIGSTESCHIFISNRPGDIEPDCSGRPVEGYEVRVVDDAGQDLPPGEPGLLMVKGDSICAGYWRQRELTRQHLIGKWLRTGDVYVRHDSGHFRYQGRRDDMLKVGGMWVSPAEIEEVMLGHERVVECAVVGVPDRHLLVRPEAFVVLEGVSDESDHDLVASLRQHVRQLLGGNKTPRAFHVVDSIPRTETGQIERFKLAERARRG
jgi:benzoate-CoA ligase family protein